MTYSSIKNCKHKSLYTHIYTHHLRNPICSEWKCFHQPHWKANHVMICKGNAGTEMDELSFHALGGWEWISIITNLFQLLKAIIRDQLTALSKWNQQSASTAQVDAIELMVLKKKKKGCTLIHLSSLWLLYIPHKSPFSWQTQSHHEGSKNTCCTKKKSCLI